MGRFNRASAEYDSQIGLFWFCIQAEKLVYDINVFLCQFHTLYSGHS